MFQVPKSTHIVILCGIEAVQMRAQKKSELEKLFFRRALLQLSFLAIPANFVVYFLIFGKAAKDRMAQSAAWRAKAPKSLFSPSFWVNNVPSPIGSSPSMREKNIFWSLKN